MGCVVHTDTVKQGHQSVKCVFALPQLIDDVCIIITHGQVFSDFLKLALSSQGIYGKGQEWYATAYSVREDVLINEFLSSSHHHRLNLRC